MRTNGHGGAAPEAVLSVVASAAMVEVVLSTVMNCGQEGRNGDGEVQESGSFD